MDLRDDLRFICAAIDANLRYAEGKHASFVAFNGVALFGGFGIVRSLNVGSGEKTVLAVLGLTMCFLLCAIITSIYSFIPRIIHQAEARPAASNGNVLFFEHVKLHSVESYEKLLCEQYRTAPGDFSPLDRCILSQVIVNARLASRKFALFRLVAMFDLAAITFALCGVLLVTVFR